MEHFYSSYMIVKLLLFVKLCNQFIYKLPCILPFNIKTHLYAFIKASFSRSAFYIFVNKNYFMGSYTNVMLPNISA